MEVDGSCSTMEVSLPIFPMVNASVEKFGHWFEMECVAKSAHRRMTIKRTLSWRDDELRGPTWTCSGRFVVVEVRRRPILVRGDVEDNEDVRHRRLVDTVFGETVTIVLSTRNYLLEHSSRPFPCQN